MDSGNSGSLSLQSSSGGGGGEDEFDSRCGGGDEDSSPLSALLRQPPAPSSSSAAVQLPGFGGSSAFYSVHDLATQPQAMMSQWSSSPATTQLPAATAPHSSSTHGDQAAAALGAASAQQAPQAARASRKRTRAGTPVNSCTMAPTTVLTTDTSNFRAMVQEFTGVPAPPFAPGAGAARSSRFDHLFSSRPAALSSPYLLRPFAHKLQAQASPSPYLRQPIISTPPASAGNKVIAPSTEPRTTTAVASSSSASFHLTSVEPTGVLGMPDHGNYLSFQSPAVLDRNASRYPTAQSMFDAAGPPPAQQRLPDPDGFTCLAHGQMNSRQHGGGDELSGLVGAASASRAMAPLLERNARSTTTAASATTTTLTPVATTAAMRPRGGVESSWICTSDQ